ETLGQPLQATFACVKKDANQGPFLVATIAGCMTQVIGNASQVGAGSNDEEVVHQLRIGLRHLRTALRELRANRHGADPAWAPVLRGVFKELGVHRDRLVVIPNIRAELLEAGSLPLGNLAGGAGDRSLVQVARDPALQQTLLDILTFLHRPVKLINATSRSDGKARRLVAGRLDKLHRLIARDVERFSALQPARQHRVRKRVGRLLFLSVAAEPIFERKHVERYIKSWREAQFSLGKSNDLRTGNDALIAGAFQGAGAEFAAEWLPERRRKSAKHCQRALRKVMKKPVFWGK
ncbi:MAG: CHAD domain-containing protein, partial [Caldimonas sp.]